jgi:hypothetical protein
MTPLKEGLFDIYFHRKDAENAEDLFYFLLSVDLPPLLALVWQGGRKAKISNPSES